MKKYLSILIYLILITFVTILFWITNIDAMFYSIMVIFIIIPLITFITSFIIGYKNIFGHFKYIFIILSGVLFCAHDYLTFSLANNIAFDKVNPIDVEFIFIGAIISLIGMFLGIITKKIIKTKKTH